MKQEPAVLSLIHTAYLRRAETAERKDLLLSANGIYDRHQRVFFIVLSLKTMVAEDDDLVLSDRIYPAALSVELADFFSLDI